MDGISIDEKFEQLKQTIQGALGRFNVTVEEKKKINTALRKRFKRINEEFKISDEFSGYIDGIAKQMDDIEKNANSASLMNNCFESIQKLIDVLENGKLPDESSSQSEPSHSTVPKYSTLSVSPSNSNQKFIRKTLMACRNRGSLGQLRKKKEIAEKVEWRLKNLEKGIEQNRSAELSMDDLANDRNPFTDVGSMMSKYVRCCSQLVKLRNEKTPPIRLPSYKDSGYEQIDKAITKLIRRHESMTNGNSHHPKSGIYPFSIRNFKDIHTVVNEVNERNNLGLSEEGARELVKKIGEDLAKRNKKKYQTEFGNYIKSLVVGNDPPEINDPELAEKLVENDKSKKSIEQDFREILMKLGVNESTEEDAKEDEMSGDECRESEETDEDENEDGDGEEDESMDKDEDEANVTLEYKPEFKVEAPDQTNDNADCVSVVYQSPKQPNAPTSGILDVLKKATEKRKLGNSCTVENGHPSKEKKIEIVDLSDDN